MKSAMLSRRHFVCGVASLALFPAELTTQAEAANRQVTATGYDPSSQHWLEQLRYCYRAFKAADEGRVSSHDPHKEWIRRYDALVNAGDVLRETITDDTPGKDLILFEAAFLIPPPCERARTYWNPVEGMSPDFQTLARAFFTARAANACALAPKTYDRMDGRSALTRALISTAKALGEARPATKGDRVVLRRVIESLNNNDMADVVMARVAYPECRHMDFRSWARSCGSYTCARCEALLGGIVEHGAKQRNSEVV